MKTKALLFILVLSGCGVAAGPVASNFDESYARPVENLVVVVLADTTGREGEAYAIGTALERAIRARGVTTDSFVGESNVEAGLMLARRLDAEVLLVEQVLTFREPSLLSTTAVGGEFDVSIRDLDAERIVWRTRVEASGSKEDVVSLLSRRVLATLERDSFLPPVAE